VNTLERFLQDPDGAADPRLTWLAREAKAWAKRGEKALVFVHRREALALVKAELEFHTSRRVAVFHEDLSPEARDLEVARFADPEGPAVLVSTESGGEGRNFQFARRLVLFDLPWEPALVEQRIGRLDRIDRRGPVEIVYFRPSEGIGAEVVRLVERLGVFEEPLGALDRELGGISAAIREVAADPSATLDADTLAREAHAALERVHESAFHQLHPERWRPELAADIFARIPKDLEPRTRAVVLEACRQYGFTMEPKGGVARWYLEFGHEASIETLHGVAPEQRWLGTFDREEACLHETLDFFAAGHPIVEAVLAEIADGTRGQVALLEMEDDGDAANAPATRAGIVVVTREGTAARFRGWDLEGRERPEWAEQVARGGPGVRPAAPGTWNVPQWSERVTALWSRIDGKAHAVAIAGVRVEPRSGARAPARQARGRDQAP
jgi:ATP-dependent helicase HepA